MLVNMWKCVHVYIYIYIYIYSSHVQAGKDMYEPCSLPRMDCMNESRITLHNSDYGVGKIFTLDLWFRNGPARLAACIRYHFSPKRRSRTDTCTDTHISTNRFLYINIHISL